jgi:hypothetical protein
MSRFYNKISCYSVNIFKIVYFGIKHNQNDKVKEDEMGRACNTNRKGEECIQYFGGKARRKETTRKP